MQYQAISTNSGIPFEEFNPQYNAPEKRSNEKVILKSVGDVFAFKGGKDSLIPGSTAY